MQNYSLKQLIQSKNFLRIVEVHNGLSGLIANRSIQEKNGKLLSFDGFWESSFTDAASKGLPDIEITTLDSRLETITQILHATSKPLIVDGDTGGDVNRFRYMVTKLEEVGVEMVIIEDKTFPKRNSFIETVHKLEEVEIFAKKIKQGLKARRSNNFMIVARLEGLIAGYSMLNTVERAKTFLQAGVDGIMIHSKKTSPHEIIEFANLYKKLPRDLIKGKLLVCIPTTYNKITAGELAKHGFNIIIYANHLLRSAYNAMEKVCRTILLNDRSFEAESFCAPMEDIFEITGSEVGIKNNEASSKKI